jgi:hypothetical protein
MTVVDHGSMTASVPDRGGLRPACPGAACHCVYKRSTLAMQPEHRVVRGDGRIGHRVAAHKHVHRVVVALQVLSHREVVACTDDGGLTSLGVGSVRLVSGPRVTPVGQCPGHHGHRRPPE